MSYYQSLQWLPYPDKDLLKKFNNKNILPYNSNFINSRFDHEVENNIAKYIHFNKNKIKNNNIKKLNLNIISGSNISFMQKSIFLNSLRNNMFLNINSFENYNLMDSFFSYNNSLTKDKTITLIALDTFDLLKVKKKFFLSIYIKSIEKILKTLSEKKDTVIVQTLVNYEKSYYDINKINKKIIKLSKKYRSIVFDVNKIVNSARISNWFDKEKYDFAQIPFSIENLKYYSFKLSKLINILIGGTKKVLVLDLDNTLWGGIVGDDGIKKIKIGNKDNISKIFFNFQNFIKKLKSRGILLAVSSKNSEKIIIETFKKKKMPLKLNDFVSLKCNWKDKPSNIREISNELNLSLDSFVFFDDNPLERDVVRKNIPELSVPEVDKNPKNYIRDLATPGYFDSLSFSKEDAKRTQIYQSNIKRKNLLKKSLNLNAYLKSLKMKSEMSNFKKIYLQRISQLFLRSNQFNLTTTRYQKKNLLDLIKKKSSYTLQATLTDKFGENGIVSLVIGSYEDDKLIIENWVMSCRVLSRNLEYAIIKKIILDLKNRKNIKKIIGIFKPSGRNNLVKNHYKKLGFKLKKNDNKVFLWEMDVKKFKNDTKRDVIKIING